MHSLLLTMGGSPFLYYGDEIGMGDNIWLEDRNGLRTPMQWDDSLNAGFSSASPEKLYAPVISDGIYGYAQVNVAAQRTDPNSLLNHVRQMLAIRKQHPTFGWGTFDWEDTGNNAIAAYQRTTEEEALLIFNNLSDQTISLSLPEDFWGAKDILTGQQFTEAHIQLEPYRFIWLRPLS